MKYAKKSLGQNFLADQNIVKKIISLVHIENRNVLEIGPGKGALTDQILKKQPKSVILVEKDNALSKFLKSKYEKNKKIKIYNEDILKFDLNKNLKKDTIVFGNLPYNISSQILANIIRLKTNPPKYSALIFMFQKELAEKIDGKFGTPKYGRLSILTKYKLNILNKFNVSSNCFIPKPKVESTIIHFVPYKLNIHKIQNIENLEKITRILFSNKRKMINKGFSKLFKNPKYFSQKIGINLSLRPDQINENDFYRIVEHYEKYKRS